MSALHVCVVIEMMLSASHAFFGGGEISGHEICSSHVHIGLVLLFVSSRFHVISTGAHFLLN